ncbi:MAG: Crp/Fnr family transcriptional regulator [Deltaproteobacteria bacterium]|nr:Crp/Fnr family transcriptional regulator [Deltaproteobacteria bacterium]
MMFRNELLKQIPLFNSLMDASLNTLAASLRLQTVRQGQVIFHKGDEGTALYIIKSGAVKIVLSSRLGAEIIASIHSEGDFFGEMALLDGEPRYADAIAVKPSEMLVLRQNDFFSFIQSDINAARSILYSLTRRLRKTHDLLRDICWLTISQRLAKLILELGNIYGLKEEKGIFIDLALTQKELGDMVGATRESINKELKALRTKGIIEMASNRIKICDPFRLRHQTL